MTFTSRVLQTAVGEAGPGVEISHDELHATTGNLWVEVVDARVPHQDADGKRESS